MPPLSARRTAQRWRDCSMKRITMLREQAFVLRRLAGSFDIEAIRNQLLDLAMRCDALASALEANPGAAGITRTTSAATER